MIISIIFLANLSAGISDDKDINDKLDEENRTNNKCNCMCKQPRKNSICVPKIHDTLRNTHNKFHSKNYT